jgi:hypothetical protein
MKKREFPVRGLIAVSVFLGFTALLVSFCAAAVFETRGGTSSRELIAACVAAALYLAFCQFWVAPQGRGKFQAKGLTVVCALLAAAILASAVWRPRERDPSSKGTLGTTAFLALFLTLVYCPIGVLVSGHGPALRIASVVLVLCAVCGLMTAALMIVTSVIADRDQLCA